MTSCDLQAAIVIGMIAGAGYTSMEHMLVSWQIDDPVGSFPVHYVGGFLGVILTPIFANHEQPYSWVYWKGTNSSVRRAPVRDMPRHKLEDIKLLTITAELVTTVIDYD